MKNTNSIQIFIKEKKDEQAIFLALGKGLGFHIESIDFPSIDARGFAQVTYYSQGWSQGILVTWPSNLRPSKHLDEIVKDIAIHLQTAILLEPIDANHLWLCAHADGLLTRRSVTYLDDGIDIDALE